MTTKTEPVRARARDDDLANTLLAVALAGALGDDANVAAYHVLVGRYPPQHLLCAFETARRLPAAAIRRSRGAYFTHLLHEICKTPPTAESSDSPSATASSAPPFSTNNSASSTSS